MSDSDKTKEQLIEELKALRGQTAAAANPGSADPVASANLTRRDVLTGWVAPVILTVPLIPRSGMAAAEGGGNKTGADFTAFPTKLNIQADGPAGSPTNSPTFTTNSPTFTTFSPTVQNTPSTMQPPTQQPTQVTTQPPTQAPTAAPTQSPTQQPTSSPTVSIPVELTEFEVNG